MVSDRRVVYKPANLQIKDGNCTVCNMTVDIKVETIHSTYLAKECQDCRRNLPSCSCRWEEFSYELTTYTCKQCIPMYICTLCNKYNFTTCTTCHRCTSCLIRKMWSYQYTLFLPYGEKEIAKRVANEPPRNSKLRWDSRKKHWYIYGSYNKYFNEWKDIIYEKYTQWSPYNEQALNDICNDCFTECTICHIPLLYNKNICVHCKLL